MKTMPAQLSAESRKVDEPKGPKIWGQGAGYPLQVAAHLYFIFSGLWLTARLTARRLARLGPADADAERVGLHKGFVRYLKLLENWKIVTVEFRGFEGCRQWRGSVVASNHPTILDAVALISRIPGLDCVMNTRVLRDPVMGGAARLCNFVLNEAPLPMVRACRERLEEGSNLLIFPEGTRTRTPPLGPFHHGYALAAIRTGAPIRTVFIECDSPYFGRTFSFFRPAPCPMSFRLTAGKVFKPRGSDDPRKVSSEIEEYFRAELTSAAGGIGLRQR